MALDFHSIDDLTLYSMSGSHYFKIKFWQGVSSQKYYRLRCSPYSSTSTVGYFYLEQFNTVPNYIYTNYFRILNGQGSTADFTFDTFFSSRPDTTTVRYVVHLQSSSSASFSSYTESSEQHILNIELDNKNGNFSPAWASPTWSDTRSTANIRKITGSTNNGLQGVSNIRISLSSASGRYGATIDKYSITIPGAYSRNYTSSNLPSYIDFDLSTYKSIKSNVDIEFKVEDSRGFVRTYKKTLNIYSYLPPSITVNNTHRQNGTGKKLILNFTGSWYGNPPLNDGTNPLLECNSITAYEEGSSTAFSTFVFDNNDHPLIVSNKSFSYNGIWEVYNSTTQVYDEIDFDSSKSYRIDYELTDGIKTVTESLTIPVGTPVIAVRKQKVGINLNDPVNTLDVVGIIGQNGFPVMGYVKDIADTTVNLNDYRDTGIYVYSAGQGSIVTNFPNGNLNTNLLIQVISAKRKAGNNYYYCGVQKAWYSTTGDEYVRTFDGSAFQSWKKVTMT